ncbi:MAG: glycosyltransferase [Nitrospirales bacterium]
MPGKICEIDIAETISPIWGVKRYDWLYVLIRYHREPIGWLSLRNPQHHPVISERRLYEEITEQLSWTIGLKLLRKQMFGSQAEQRITDPISVVICTRDRVDLLAGCLKAVLGLDYPNYEVVVVDNAPSTDATARLVASLPVRYVREDRPGLDWARNCGIAEAHHDIIAFTDDDVRVDRAWLRYIGNTFSDPEVMAVTGFIAPAELESEAQHLFELKYGGMGKGFSRRIFRKSELNTYDLLAAQAFGVGANMSFRSRVFSDIGLFDVALDVGTPAGGGGDLDMFHRLIAKGHTLVYEPSALVWHIHRRSQDFLRQQIYDNGRSFGSYLLTCVRNRTVSRRKALTFAARQWFGRWIIPRLLRPRGFPRRLTLAELRGALRSPRAYSASQKRAKALAVAHDPASRHPCHKGMLQ